MTGLYRDDAFADRHVVVTGGASGIGAAVASAFAEVGATVVAAGIFETSNPQPEKESRIICHSLDVTDDVAVAAFFEGIEDLYVLVNCAGVIRREDEYDLEIFDDVLDVNLAGTMRCSMAARGSLESAGGSIINFASMTSFFGSAHAPAYGASKAAIAQLTKSLAIRFAPRVRVNAIAPGWIRTGLTTPVENDPAANRRILDRTPAGRWGVPAEIAGAVLYLASSAAAFVTGAVLAVDGGYSAS